MEYAVAWIVAALVITLIFWIVRTVKRQNEIYRSVRQRLGFSEVTPIDRDFVERIARVKEHQKSKLIIKRLYKREESGYTLCDFQYDYKGSDSSATPMHVMIGRHWDFPAFKMIPKIEGGGMLKGLLGQALNMIMKRGGFRPVEIPGAHRFNEQYTVLARDDDELKRKVPQAVWDALAAVPEKLMLFADGDLVDVGRFDITRKRPKGSFEELHAKGLRDAIDLSAKVAAALSSCSRESSFMRR